MAGSCNSRRCFGFGVGKVGVSKVGPSAPRPPSSETPVHGYYPGPDESTRWGAATVIVVLAGVVAFVVMTVAVVILRRKRIREEQMRNRAENGNVVKGGQGDEGVNKEGQWSAGAVELVVMAGETQPTFLAHPVPTPTTHPVQCPPLILPKDHTSHT
jgi:hypothetical protein